jgi:hypothetical protein
VGQWHQKVYDQIIAKYQNHPKIKGETESHHITPRSLGGNDDKENLVNIPVRVHFIAHKLLVRIHWNNPTNKQKMCAALWMMSRFSKYSNSIEYETARKELSDYVKEQFRSGTHHLIKLIKSDQHPAKVRARQGLPPHVQKYPERVSEGGRRGGLTARVRVLEGTHIFQKPEFLENNERVRTELLHTGQHNFQTAGFQSTVQKALVLEGRHHFLGPEGNIKSWKDPSVREARCRNISLNKRLNAAKRRIAESRPRAGDEELVIELTLLKGKQAAS